MKLASLKRGGRDGSLIVADQKMVRGVLVPDVAPTLQYALENWTKVVPALCEVSDQMDQGDLPSTFAIIPDELASPLPRAYQFLDGSVYLSHMEKARKARNAAMPAEYETVPLMYQGMSDDFLAPTEAAPFLDDKLGIDLEAEIAIVVDDVPMGINDTEALEHIKLVMLLNDWTLRELTRFEVPRGFGFIQSKPASAFSPFAVTPDELGSAWRDGVLDLALNSSVNGSPIGAPRAGQDMYFNYGELIAHAARSRKLGAGTIIAAGTVSNRDERSGHGCIAEVRVDETIASGTPTTAFLTFGDSIRIEMFGHGGRSVFGAIEQTVVRAKTS